MQKTKNDINEEALKTIHNLQLSGVNISMGVGKTLIGLNHMRDNYTLSKKFLVVVPKLSIKKSWENDMEKFNLLYLLPHITFSTYLSLSKQDCDYDIIYLDECHSLKEKHDPWLSQHVNENGRILGLSGTYPINHYGEKWKMCNKYCPLVYTYNTDNAVNDNILNDYEIIIHKLQLSDKKDIPKNGKYGSYHSSESKDYANWCNIVDSNPKDFKTTIYRMKLLQSFETKEKYAKKLLTAQTTKTLLFAPSKKQAGLCEHSYYSGNVNSLTNLEDFKKGIITKMSSVEQLKEGINIPDLKTCIILHSYGNNVQAAQKIGRALRLNPKDKATIHLLCYMNTVDEKWVTQAVESFDDSKIKWIEPMFKL